ncbi:MAG: hypothetical protein WC637_08430 [Victivallales bacterium]|jgi:hypothetical protein
MNNKIQVNKKFFWSLCFGFVFSFSIMILYGIALKHEEKNNEDLENKCKELKAEILSFKSEKDIIEKLNADIKNLKLKETENAQSMGEMKNVIVLLTEKDNPISVELLKRVVKALEKNYPQDISIVSLKSKILRIQGENERDRRRAIENVRKIKEVKTDLISFVDKEFVIDGYVRLASYYNYKYRNARDTHFSFLITDNSDSFGCYAYIEKTSILGQEMRSQLLKDEPRRGTFNLIIPKDKSENDGEFLAGLLMFGPPLDLGKN